MTFCLGFNPCLITLPYRQVENTQLKTDLILFDKGQLFGSGTEITKSFPRYTLMKNPSILTTLGHSESVWLDGKVKWVDTSKKYNDYICTFPIPGKNRDIEVTLQGEDAILELNEAYWSKFHRKRRDAASSTAVNGKCAAGKLPVPAKRAEHDHYTPVTSKLKNTSDNGQKVIEVIGDDAMKQKIIELFGPPPSIQPPQYYKDLITHYARVLPPVPGSFYDYDIVVENDPDETSRRDTFITSRVSTIEVYYLMLEDVQILTGEHGALQAYLARDRPVPRTKQPESEATTKEDQVDAYVSSRLPEGFTLLRIYRDQSNMFRALARLHYGAGNRHMQLRKEIVDYVASNYDDLSVFMPGETKATYMARMLNTKKVENGSGFELMVAVKLLQRQITVLGFKDTTSLQPMTSTPLLLHGHEPDESKTLYLVYVDEKHYHAGFVTQTS
jgi:hypothetical protein